MHSPEAHEAEAPFEYRLLVGHQRTDGSWKSTEELHSEYVRLTDELVHKVTEGVEVLDKETGQMIKKPVDYMVFLDKSSRPVQWLMHDLWPTLAADAKGNIPPEPGYRFVNIDRNQWASTIDSEGTGITQVDKLDQSVIRSLRSIFVSDPRDRSQGLTERIDSAPTQFDGKTVLIVDEVLSSGRTLEYARDFFKRAFPDANIAGTHWMGKLTTKGQAVGNADLPVWYSDKTVLGRGVGNRNVDLSRSRGGTVRGTDGVTYETNPNLSAQRLGAYFLSVGLRQPDELSSQLRKELHQLAEDARDSKILVEPSPYRDEADFDERALRLNGFTTMQEYADVRRARSSVK